MEIELDDLIVCEKCSVLFDYTKHKYIHETDYQKSKIYITICPVCKNKKKVFT